MQRTARLLVALSFLISSIAVVPHATALPTDEIGTEYYDECMNLIGSHIITCEGQVYDWGTSTGAKYKNRYNLPCDNGPGYSSKWYEWNGTSWVLLPGVPVVDC